MEVLVRNVLHEEPAQDLQALIEQFVEAEWLETRQMELMAKAVNNGFNGGK